MVGYLYNDSLTTNVKDLLFSEKDLGTNGWTQSSLNVDTTQSGMALAFDPITRRFVVAYLDSDHEIVIRSRALAGGSWTAEARVGNPPANAYDSIDIACSAWANTTDDNCMLVYISANSSTSVRTVAFEIPGPSFAPVFQTNINRGYYGFVKPRVVARQQNFDPKFFFAFSQLGSTIYTRSQDRNTTTWSSETPNSSPGDDWFRPAALGTYGTASDILNMPTSEN